MFQHHYYELDWGHLWHWTSV